MSWMVFALTGAFCWALIHHLDKLLLSKFSLYYGVGALVIFSCLFPVLILPIFLVFVGVAPFAFSFTTIATLVGSGILGAIAVLLYFYALEKEETTVVVSMYQLSPVFGYLLGIVFLGETLAQLQIIGALVTILGVTILSFELLEERKVRVRKRMSLFIVASAFVYALGNVIYKGGAIGETPYFAAMFWVFVGYIIFGVGALLIKEYRDNFLSIIRSRKQVILGLNLVNESLQTVALMCTAYALLLAPVALVLVMDSYQPILVFIVGILLSVFAPTLASEKITLWHFLHKATAISIAVLGTVLMQVA